MRHRRSAAEQLEPCIARHCARTPASEGYELVSQRKYLRYGEGVEGLRWAELRGGIPLSDESSRPAVQEPWTSGRSLRWGVEKLDRSATGGERDDARIEVPDRADPRGVGPDTLGQSCATRMFKAIDRALDHHFNFFQRIGSFLELNPHNLDVYLKVRGLKFETMSPWTREPAEA